MDEKRRASACFAGVAHPSPPPPPDGVNLKGRHGEIEGMIKRTQRGEGDPFATPRVADDDTWKQQSKNAIAEVQELLRELGETQPVLKSMLQDSISELETRVYSGRRLMVREDYSLMMTDALVDHPVMRAVGNAGLAGLTQFTCEALCSGISDDQNASNAGDCRAYAFRRDFPFSRRDLTGHCFLLKNAGACKVEDFGVELYLRHYDSENVCSEITPGLDSEPCIGLPATHAESNTLTHYDAAAIAAKLPNMRHRAYGSGGLAFPRSTLEAMCKQRTALDPASTRPHLTLSVPRSQRSLRSLGSKELIASGPPAPTPTTAQS